MGWDEESFWAGYVLGRQVKGWSAYVTGKGPDISRYLSVSVKRLPTHNESGFTARPFTATPTPEFPVQADRPLVLELGRLRFGVASFGIREIETQLDGVEFS